MKIKYAFYVLLLLSEVACIVINLYSKLSGKGTIEEITGDIPYTIIVFFLVVIEWYSLFLCQTEKNLEEHNHPNLVLELFQIISFIVPTLFAMGFVYAFRSYYEITVEEYSKFFKYIFIIFGGFMLLIYKIKTLHYAYQHKIQIVITEKNNDDLRWRHFMVQLACFNGFVDALTYAIIAPTYYINNVDYFNSETMFNIMMISMMFTGMTWYRFSHEFYAMFSPHHEEHEPLSPDEIDIENAEHFKDQETTVRCLYFVPYFLLIAVVTVVRYIYRDTLLIIGVVLNIICIGVLICLFVHWFHKQKKSCGELLHHSKLSNHDYVYYCITVVLSCISIWWLNAIHLNEPLHYNTLEIVSIIITLLYIIFQYFNLAFNVKMTAIFRPLFILINLSQLIDALYIDTLHYGEMYNLINKGEHFSQATLSLAFLYWAMVENLLQSTYFHLQYYAQ